MPRSHDPDGSAPVLAALDRLEDAGQALDLRTRDSLGVNTIDYAVLRWVERVHRRGGTTRVGDIAQHFGVSSGSATEIVHRLTRAGLLQRAPHPTDARVRRLEPTAEALERMSVLVGGTRAELDSLLATVTDAERERMAELLSAVTAILEGRKRPGGGDR
ncbi:MarR family winged helix-turn-helix transcriptional regulator [Amnibacterium endophyticum]|uniref:MarR family winged helix-turn-helix transcriptional regulator n=1 Tax=Amnibacterium endophyticum TaxID=2109337 RepID=A0ABW4LL69_9MICO